MNRQKGLLVFLCTIQATACVLLQIPIALGLKELWRTLSDWSEDSLPPLVYHLRAADATELPSDTESRRGFSLYDLQNDRRADQEVKQLALTHQIPFALLKAHLAATSEGVLGVHGLFWSRLPEADEEVPEDDLSRTRWAAALFSRYWWETGSLEGAVLAWKTGILRAGRVVAKAGSGLENTRRALRLHLPAFYREEARNFLCTVYGLAAALEARWPVLQQETKQLEVGVQLLTRSGEMVYAPMPGRVGWVGTDGSRGLCVEMVHACDLCSEICSLHTVAVQPGAEVREGQRLGQAGPKAPWFGLRLGRRPLDPRVIKPLGT